MIALEVGLPEEGSNPKAFPGFCHHFATLSMSVPKIRIAVFLALAMVVGACELTTETRVQEYLVSASTDSIEVSFRSVDVEMFYLYAESEGGEIRIRAQSESGAAIGIDLANVTGPATHFIAPIPGKSGSALFVGTDGRVYRAREASSQTIQVTEYDGSRIAGSFRVSAVATNGEAGILDVYFEFAL